MLELKNIIKDYPAGDGVVHALRGVDLTFGKSEFVSILGPSGCGKTTLLNIIGGLDGYTDGDLIINGTSTKDYKDRDWDTYRNHSIGFVFQSYNLIPHQTVLQNVELALTLSGVGKAERRQRAKDALKLVGLETQYNKRPGEMSGGQMQRVAIARAIVNNPDIILADEPTGALDTETSLQVMEILKEISKERLVIMVTHNPELAEKYSTRIIRMLDGVITGDTRPAVPEVAEEKTAKAKKDKKPSMSFATSFSLSLKNLFTKKGRTVLTSFAGSIGIIGIALILAVSQGTTAYIDTVQEDTLSSYPLMLEAKHMDFGTIMTTFLGTAQAAEKHENDAVYQKAMMYDMINALNNMEASENDLASFKKYIEKQKKDEESKLYKSLSGVQYSYGLDMLVYTKSADGEIIRSDSQAIFQDLMAEMFGMDMSSMMGMASGGGFMSMSSSNMSSPTMWQQLLPGDSAPVSDLLDKQYDIVYGAWPDEYNEIVLVLDSNNELDDLTLYALGLKPKADIDAIMDAAINGTELNIESRKWTYEEICSLEYKVILNSDCFKYDEVTGVYTDLRDTDTGLKYLYDNGMVLKVSGIIKPSEDAVASMLTGSIGYTHLLTEHIVEKSESSAAIKAQLDDPTLDIFTNLPFKPSKGSMANDVKEKEFKEYIKALDTAKKAEAYIGIKSIPTEDFIKTTLEQTLSSMSVEDMRATLLQAFTQQMGMGGIDVEEYINAMSDEDIKEYFAEMVKEQLKQRYAQEVASRLSQVPAEQRAALLDAELGTYTTEMCAQYYDEILEFSDSTYEENLKALGYVDLDKPTMINLYAASFADKDVIEEVIKTYNEDVEELSRINYTDYVGLLMSSVTTIIDAITYVLISFVAVSLIVSSIMIGVITLISVQERTKEIGILRAIGASKKNVSRMFNAETMIIGFTSGLMGVLITYLLCIPINIILHYVTGINNLSAQLPIGAAVILVIISMLLTLFAGIIPSRSAAKKDPVVALRTE
ncbi:MAG: ABC transporter ATP-binding protein/permease [Clostridia bacterium]|nr:ABC transporter ATP-binding protein/permease [Clostridia bacterium]